MKKEGKQNLSLLFQFKSCKVEYSLNHKDMGFNSPINDCVIVKCQTIASNYRNIKVNDTVQLRFTVLQTFNDKDCCPTGFGEFDIKDKQVICYVFPPSSLINRLDFILNRGIKPYFYLTCEKVKYQKPIIKNFYMESEVEIKDYI